MKRVISLLLILVFMASLTLSGCESKTKSTGEVNVCNWGEYIDESIFDEFEKTTGIKINYTTFTSNETLYSTLKSGAANYDVIIPSDYMISRLISENMLEKIDFSNIPNYDFIDSAYKDLEYDPTNEYSVAYMWGTVGIIYNTTIITDEITSWGALFDEDYSGQILMFDNPRDALGIALMYLGYSSNTTSESELREAYNLLAEQKPIVQAYVMDQIFDKLESGEAAIGPYYAGDYLSMLENNPDLAFVIPEEGSNWFVDAMCIPKGAENKTNAELFINYMCSTDVSLSNMEATGYSSPNTEAVTAISADLSDAQLAVMFPDDESMSKCQIYINLPQETLDLYDELWVSLKA